MLYYDRISVSEGNHVNKGSASKKSNICHYSILRVKGLRFNRLFAMDITMYQ